MPRLEGWAAGEIGASWFETALARFLTMRGTNSLHQ
jgi:hypothetical protein